ncbi:MAG: hypothetical protein QOF15_3340, partial [Mycobacterium sp.]|nr:hypothetical protein [Mycobacterium sp.]
ATILIVEPSLEFTLGFSNSASGERF